VGAFFCYVVFSQSAVFSCSYIFAKYSKIIPKKINPNIIRIKVFSEKQTQQKIKKGARIAVVSNNITILFFVLLP